MSALLDILHETRPLMLTDGEWNSSLDGGCAEPVIPLRVDGSTPAAQRRRRARWGDTVVAVVLIGALVYISLWLRPDLLLP